MIELGGSVLVLSGYAVWLGAGALGCLTPVAMFKADNFWTKSGQERVTQANTFFEHLGLIGGFVLIAFIYALTTRLAKVSLRANWKRVNRW